jgi:hypothetical protein
MIAFFGSPLDFSPFALAHPKVQESLKQESPKIRIKVHKKNFWKQICHKFRHFNPVAIRKQVIPFISVYYFVIEFIIPSTAGFELRSKLSGLNYLDNTVDAFAESALYLNTSNWYVRNQTKWHAWQLDLVVYDSVDRQFRGYFVDWLKASSTHQQMECLLAKKKVNCHIIHSVWAWSNFRTWVQIQQRLLRLLQRF